MRTNEPADIADQLQRDGFTPPPVDIIQQISALFQKAGRKITDNLVQKIMTQFRLAEDLVRAILTLLLNSLP